MDSPPLVAVPPPVVSAPSDSANPLRVARLREHSHYPGLRHAIDAVLILYFLVLVVALVQQGAERDWGLPLTAFALKMAWALAYRLLAHVGVDFVDMAAERRLPR